MITTHVAKLAKSSQFLWFTSLPIHSPRDEPYCSICVTRSLLLTSLSLFLYLSLPALSALSEPTTQKLAFFPWAHSEQHTHSNCRRSLRPSPRELTLSLNIIHILREPRPSYISERILACTISLKVYNHRKRLKVHYNYIHYTYYPLFRFINPNPITTNSYTQHARTALEKIRRSNLVSNLSSPAIINIYIN